MGLVVGMFANWEEVRAASPDYEACMRRVQQMVAEAAPAEAQLDEKDDDCSVGSQNLN